MKKKEEEKVGGDRKASDEKRGYDLIENEVKRSSAGGEVNEVDKERTNQKHKVMYNIDATKLHENKFFANQFDVIIFNFPFGDAVESIKLLLNDKDDKSDNSNG